MKKFLAVMMMVVLMVPIVAQAAPPPEKPIIEMTPAVEQARKAFIATGVPNVVSEAGGEVSWQISDATETEAKAQITLLYRDGLTMKVTQTTVRADMPEPSEAETPEESDGPEWVTSYEAKYSGIKGVWNVTPKTMMSFMQRGRVPKVK